MRNPHKPLTVQDLLDMLNELAIKHGEKILNNIVVLEGCDCSAALVGHTIGRPNSGLGLCEDQVLWLRQDSGVIAELGDNAPIAVPTYGMDFAESFGLGIFCESCKDAPIAVTKWDPDLKKWVDEEDRPFPKDIKALPCISCGRMYYLPNEIQVERFERYYKEVNSRRRSR